MADTTDITKAASATEGTLSNWAAPYVTDFLSKGQALSNQPYQAYTGPLTAGQSGLQQQAFQGLANLAVPTSVGNAAAGAGQVAGQLQGMAGYGAAGFNAGYNPAAGQYDPMAFSTDTWNTQQAQQYMNPYLQVSLNPQLDQARRQADISRVGNAARLTQAGAYGGSRQAIMESEGRRNLMDTQGQITGRGYDTAYAQGLNQFNADEGRQLDALRGTEQSRQFGATQGMTSAKTAADFALEQQRAAEASRQFGANYGLSALDKSLGAYNTQSQLGLAGLVAQRNVLGDQLSAGNTQRNIQQEGITADMKQFETERAYPYEMLQYQKDLMHGLPFQTSRSYTASGTDPWAAITQGAAGGVNMAKIFGTE